jgi:hypothetical protein
MGAKFATMLVNEHVRHQMFFDIKSIFSKFLVGKSMQLKLLNWNQLLPLNNSSNRFNILSSKHWGL